MIDIKITALNPGLNTIEDVQRTLRFDAKSNGFNFIWDSHNPDYVLATNIVYTDRELFKRLIRYKKAGAITIFFTGECISPDLNIFDYAIVFDRHLKSDDRVARLSARRYFEVSFFDEYLNMVPDQGMVANKTHFCNFLYSHQGHPNRDKLFYKVSEYKKVDSLGTHLNNVKRHNTRYNKDWRRLSIEERLPYKFSIAAENAEYPGYMDEKLLSCLQAHTVPIYWGDPTVTEEINPKAIINCSSFANWDEMLEYVKAVDNNDDLFLSILKEPWQTEEQKKYSQSLDENYDRFIYNIFAQGKEQARRAPSGLYPDIYLRWFEQRHKRSLYECFAFYCSRLYMFIKSKVS